MRGTTTALACLAVTLTACPPSSPMDGGGTDAVVDVPPDAGQCTTTPLAAPPAGRGIQLHVSFDVPTGTEQQQCWRFRLPSTTDMEVVRYEVGYNAGSHHMNLFRVLPTVEALPTTHLDPTNSMTGPGDQCWNAVDFSKYDLVVGSQNGVLDWTLPPGIAYRLHANSYMLMQSHFVNGVTQATPCNRADVYVNLWTAEDPTTIHQHLGTMFANNRAINLPPRSDSEFTTRCVLPTGGTFVAMTGHFHSRGQQFLVSPTTDGTTPGTQCYASPAWNQPPFTVLDQPITVPNGGGLFYTCRFHNSTDFPITFGPHVEYEEHCNLFAYYYPVDPNNRAQYCF